MNLEKKEVLQLSKVQLTASLQKLNATWNRVNETLRGLQLPVSAHVDLPVSEEEYGTVERSLAWIKHAGDWQVCTTRWFEPSSEGEVVPVIQSSARERLYLLKRVPDLYKALLDSSAAFAQDAVSECEKLEERLDRFESQLAG